MSLAEIQKILFNQKIDKQLLALVKKGDPYTLISFLKDYFSKLTDSHRKAIVDVIVEKAGSDYIAVFLMNHFLELTDKEFLTVIEKMDANVLVSFWASHVKELDLVKKLTVADEVMKRSSSYAGLTDPEFLLVIENVDSNYLTSFWMSHGRKLTSLRGIAIWCEVIKRINSYTPYPLYDVPAVIDFIINTHPDLLVSFLKEHFAALTVEQRIFTVYAITERADVRTLMKFFVQLFSKFTDEHRKILLPVVREKASPEQMLAFFKCWTSDLLTVNENEPWFHMAVERSDSAAMIGYVKEYCSQYSLILSNGNAHYESIRILRLTVRFHAMMELGEKRLRTVVEKANPKELVTLLDDASANMMDEEFRMMVENIPRDVASQLLANPKLSTEKAHIVQERLSPCWIREFLEDHYAELTPEQFRTLVEEESKLDEITPFLEEYFDKLTKGQIFAILPFLVKHHSQLPGFTLFRFLLNNYRSELTLEQFRIMVEESGLPVIVSFLKKYLSELTKEEALTILPFLEKHRAPLLPEFALKLPAWLFFLSQNGLTPEQFRIFVEISELPMIVNFLEDYLSQLAKEKALAILPFLEKHRSQLPAELFEQVARRAGF
jgi:hypothetical protein